MNNTYKQQNNNTTARSHVGIRGRLLMGFTSVVIVFFISTAVALSFLYIAQSDANNFLTRSMPININIVDMQGEVIDVELHMQSYIFLNNVSLQKNIEDQLSVIDTMAVSANTLVAKQNDPVVMESWSRLSTALIVYHQQIAEIFRLNNAKESDKARALYVDSLLPLTQKMNDLFNAPAMIEKLSPGILDVMRDSLKSDMHDITSQLSMINLTIILSLIFACFISWLIAMKTSLSILIPIRKAITIAERIASGDRDIEINTSRSDETGQLLNAMASMRDSIKAGEDKISQNAIDITQACSSMVSTLDEVRHAVDAQSSGASEQASSINEITASITEIERSASQTMNKAKDLGGVAEKTRQSGQLGVESIEASVSGMKAVRDRVQHIAQTILDLSRQTQQVGEITSVVNNLAQQSKMLALNASIEAAKAGDAGKGFAVVASEVKNLAEQSEESTSQVQKILEDIKVATEKAVMVTEEGTKGVDNGMQMIERTGVIIRDLNDVIREAALASQQIEAAVRQESAGIEQITAGMNEINTVTSSFVESVGQTTEAMGNLAQVASKLKSTIDTYNE